MDKNKQKQAVPNRNGQQNIEKYRNGQKQTQEVEQKKPFEKISRDGDKQQIHNKQHVHIATYILNQPRGQLNKEKMSCVK